MDWSEKTELVLQDKDLIEEFTLTKSFEEAFLSWHREEYPDEWGND